MLNDTYEPRGGEEDVLDVLRAEGGRLRPKHIYEELDVNTGTAQHWIDRLYAAGWIDRPREGVYEIVFDPREFSDEELSVLFVEYAMDLDVEAARERVSESPPEEGDYFENGDE